MLCSGFWRLFSGCFYAVLKRKAASICYLNWVIDALGFLEGRTGARGVSCARTWELTAAISTSSFVSLSCGCLVSSDSILPSSSVPNSVPYLCFLIRISESGCLVDSSLLIRLILDILILLLYCGRINYFVFLLIPSLCFPYLYFSFSWVACLIYFHPVYIKGYEFSSEHCFSYIL